MANDEFKRGMDEFKRQMKQNAEDLRRRVERSVEEVDAPHQGEHEAVKTTERKHTRGRRGINIAGRVNKAIVVNTGGPGSKHAASARQKTRLIQNGEETYEESEETRSSF